MKQSLVIISIIVVLCGFSVAILRSYNRNHDFASRTRTYETLEKAIEKGVIRQGWLPDFLPRSAYNIREKRNSEENTVIACCLFDPADNLLPMLSETKEVPMSITKGIRPSAIGKREAWFPDAITEGKVGGLSQAGFRLYRSERRVKVGSYEVMAIWHLAINQKAGTCYFWFFQRMPAP